MPSPEVTQGAYSGERERSIRFAVNNPKGREPSERITLLSLKILNVDAFVHCGGSA